MCSICRICDKAVTICPLSTFQSNVSPKQWVAGVEVDTSRAVIDDYLGILPRLEHLSPVWQCPVSVRRERGRREAYRIISCQRYNGTINLSALPALIARVSCQVHVLGNTTESVLIFLYAHPVATRYSICNTLFHIRNWWISPITCRN